jgi:Flp pilus assembly protein protease CpaA
MNLELLRVAVALAGVSIAAWQDAKTSFIDERIIYVMLAAGLVLDVATFDVGFIAFSVGIAAAIFVLGWASYRTGQLGGGDVYLFVALALLLPFYPSSLGTFAIPGELRIFPFFVSVFIASAFFGILGSAVMYAGKLRGRRLKPDLLSGGIVIAALVVALVWFSQWRLSLAQGVFFAAFMLPGAFLLSFKRQIMNEVIVRRIPISKIEDEDIMAIDEMNPKLVKKYNLHRVLTKKEVEKLKLVQKKEGIKTFPVCKELPRFGPYILLGLIASLLAGDLFAFILMS